MLQRFFGVLSALVSVYFLWGFIVILSAKGGVNAAVIAASADGGILTSATALVVTNLFLIIVPAVLAYFLLKDHFSFQH